MFTFYRIVHVVPVFHASTDAYTGEAYHVVPDLEFTTLGEAIAYCDSLDADTWDDQYIVSIVKVHSDLTVEERFFAYSEYFPYAPSTALVFSDSIPF